MEQVLPGLASATNLHPMLVHFPIAFWLAATGAWAFGLLRKNDVVWSFGLWLHSWGLLGAGLAAALGFWASSQMGHETPGHDLVHVHRDLMLWTTGLAVVVTGLGWWKKNEGYRVPLTLLSVVLVVLLTFGADRGAALVYRHGMGVAVDASSASHLSHSDSDGGHGEHEH